LTRTRGPDLSKEFKDYIFNQWVYKQRNAYQIANEINGDSELMSKFGKTTPAGIHYHIVRIREDLENTINESALDTYIGEFIRAKEGFDQDVAAIDDLIKLAHEKDDIELELKLRRHRHEVKIDRFRMLQDSELPLQVKKLQLEKKKLQPKQGIIKEVEDHTQRTSEQRDTSTDQ